MAWLGQVLNSVISSKSGIKFRRRLGLGPATVANHELDQVPIKAEVVVYFSDVTNKAYQLEQWLPILEQLHQSHPVLLVFRKVQSLRYFRFRTKLPKVFVRRLDDLVKLYDFNDFRLCLYVNNGVQNFQSLSSPQLVHVHINHGESDKLSMVSNQAKAYDKVFVAGPAAIERHRKVLLDFDLDKLVQVGRPQLDAGFKSLLEPYHGRTVLYAPTWEGENEANNYTSVDSLGERIINELIARPGTRVIYKPHPRILTSSTAAVTHAHERITEILQQSISLGGVHVLADEHNILDLFEDADALITDISSVGLDYLYLHPEKPLLLTNRGEDLPRLHEEAPISRCCPVLDTSNVASLINELFSPRGSSGINQRKAMRSFYFGEGVKGDSTDRFMRTINALITKREQLLRSQEVDLEMEDLSNAG